MQPADQARRVAGRRPPPETQARRGQDAGTAVCSRQCFGRAVAPTHPHGSGERGGSGESAQRRVPHRVPARKHEEFPTGKTLQLFGDTFKCIAGNGETLPDPGHMAAYIGVVTKRAIENLKIDPNERHRDAAGLVSDFTTLAKGEWGAHVSHGDDQGPVREGRARLVASAQPSRWGVAHRGAGGSCPPATGLAPRCNHCNDAR